ncbi:hypothetical protein V5O48_009600 [Marasmius crinis-equi]|uniref:F-box domain-containing protein n=1 Tax=Marasmius crinis-equi TaxID=585013 RepID=A0ABR3FB14_9AGAR
MSRAPVSSLPSEILSNILEDVVEFQSIRVQSNGRLIGNDTEWLESGLYRISVVCREWRECVKNLPAWNAITVYHDDANPYIAPPSPNTYFLDSYIEQAITQRKRLRVKLEIGSTGQRHIMATEVLRQLFKEGVLWHSLGYQSWGAGSLRILCEVLDELGERIVDWDRFEVDIGEPPFGDLSLVDVLRRMGKIRHLRNAVFDLGWPAMSYWVWNRSPDIPLVAGCLQRVRELEVKASPSICLGLLGVMSGVVRAYVYLDWEENSGWGNDTTSVKPTLESRVASLTRLTHMEVYIGAREISHTAFFHFIQCPQLRYFSIEWFESERGNGVEVVQRFLGRLCHTVVGGFYLPNATASEVRGFEGFGLEEREEGSRSWVDL